MLNPLPWDPHQRSVRWLGRDDGRIHLDDVRWGYAEAPRTEDWMARFSDARFDPRRVVKVYCAIVPFPPEWLAAHSFLIFVFDAEAPVTNREGQHDHGLCLSVEAREHVGESFDFITGLRRHYKIHYAVSTWRDEIQHTCGWQGKKIIRYELRLNADERERLLENAIAAACADHAGEYYHTVHNSCFSNIVHLLNGVLPAERRLSEYLIPHVLHTFSAANPLTGDLFLYRHGLTGHSGHVLTQPYADRYPEKQASQSAAGAVVEEATETLPLRSLFWALGVWAGTTLLPRAQWIGAVLGAYAADHAHDFLLVRSHTEYEPCEKYLYQGAQIS